MQTVREWSAQFCTYKCISIPIPPIPPIPLLSPHHDELPFAWEVPWGVWVGSISPAFDRPRPTMRGSPFSNRKLGGHDLKVCTFEPHLATLGPTFYFVFWKEAVELGLWHEAATWTCSEIMNGCHPSEIIQRNKNNKAPPKSKSKPWSAHLGLPSNIPVCSPHSLNAYRDVALHGIFHWAIKPCCRHEALQEIWEVSNHISEIKTWW